MWERVYQSTSILIIRYLERNIFLCLSLKRKIVSVISHHAYEIQVASESSSFLLFHALKLGHSMETWLKTGPCSASPGADHLNQAFRQHDNLQPFCPSFTIQFINIITNIM